MAIVGYSIYRSDDVPRVELLAIETELLGRLCPLWLTKDKMTQEIELITHRSWALDRAPAALHTCSPAAVASSQPASSGKLASSFRGRNWKQLQPPDKQNEDK